MSSSNRCVSLWSLFARNKKKEKKNGKSIDKEKNVKWSEKKDGERRIFKGIRFRIHRDFKGKEKEERNASDANQEAMKMASCCSWARNLFSNRKEKKEGNRRWSIRRIGRSIKRIGLKIRRFAKRERKEGDHRAAIDEIHESNGVVPALQDKWEVAVKWEPTQIVNHDGSLQLKTDVFYASVDQFSDRVQGYGACSVLALTVAQHMISNPTTPLSSEQFDRLIIRGAQEWQRIVPLYHFQFPGGHLDLETALTARTYHLKSIPTKSFTGFFKPENPKQVPAEFSAYIEGSLTFDKIWSGVETVVQSSTSPVFYIINFCDHFFLLCADKSNYYIVDSSGARLGIWCKSAYIIRFDDATSLNGNGDGVSGKEACKLYIEWFIAKRLLADISKVAEMSLLADKYQVEFTCIESKAARPTPHSDHPTISRLDKQKDCVPDGKGLTGQSSRADTSRDQGIEKDCEEWPDWMDQKQAKLKPNVARPKHRSDPPIISGLEHQKADGTPDSNCLSGSKHITGHSSGVDASASERYSWSDKEIDCDKSKEDHLMPDSKAECKTRFITRPDEERLLEKNSDFQKMPLSQEEDSEDCELDSDSNGTPQRDIISPTTLVVCLMLCVVMLVMWNGRLMSVEKPKFSVKSEGRTTGELHLVTAPFNSLMLFGTPNCSRKAHDLASTGLDLVRRPGFYYRSPKEADRALCLYYAKYVTGVEKCHYNWSEIVEPSGTKSKEQCVKCFIIVVEDWLLENFDIPKMPLAEELDLDVSNWNFKSIGTPKQDDNSGSWYPFAVAPDIFMSQVPFLTPAIGPSIPPAFANATLCVFIKKDSRTKYSNSESKHVMKEKISASCEIQTVINRQLGRLELKLKRIAKTETLLVLKECEGLFDWAHPLKP